MPKGRKLIKVDNRVIKLHNRRSQRIGTRKNGVAANTLTNDALREILNDTSKCRHHSKAIVVLKNRGASL